MVLRGKRYLVIDQFQRNGTVFLQRVEKPGDQVTTIPAAITDITNEANKAALHADTRAHFTIPGLNEAAFILDKALTVSTK